MKSQLFLALLLATIPSSAYAHVEAGTHAGKTADGKDCSFRAIKTYFENEKPHPLNERVLLEVDGVEFTVAHPPVIDAAQSLAYFNHDAFHGLIPTSKGAKALVVNMVHEGDSEGPKSFTYIEHEWKADSRKAYECLNLELKR